MENMELFFLLCLVLCVSSDGLHDSFRFIACTDTEGFNMITLDDEEVWHADFIQQKGVDTMPDFVSHPSTEGLFEQSVGQQELCKYNLKRIRKGLKDIPDAFDAPSALVYNANSVELEEKNILICHVSGFYPAPVNVSWTKNNQKVTEGTSINVPFPNKDSTFTQISRLDFIPQLGDVYSCSVEHPALQEPLSTIWEVELDSPQPSIGPAVFCGVGLTVGLLGVTVGTFFLIKGNELIGRS
ncbi:PREDICTED: H-2 class II histocompatibility antigen, A-U alpha chain-like [Cyprinodon variegatus]|uniref:H-2 class II histocompatibility antigen, A-U alpha chain-like n=1 Tax=Cyprinodon variegatus TaxID=28743 RepID=A0A3Q2DR69_CYPVA|nr:PREDICTED: H-2 class II histocompatibility antigen, A-U alpha chain-like [Cyprinodon variegatus]